MNRLKKFSLLVCSLLMLNAVNASADTIDVENQTGERVYLLENAFINKYDLKIYGWEMIEAGETKTVNANTIGINLSLYAVNESGQVLYDSKRETVAGCVPDSLSNLGTLDYPSWPWAKPESLVCGEGLVKADLMKIDQVNYLYPKLVLDGKEPASYNKLLQMTLPMYSAYANQTNAANTKYPVRGDARQVCDELAGESLCASMPQ